MPIVILCTYFKLDVDLIVFSSGLHSASGV